MLVEEKFHLQKDIFEIKFFISVISNERFLCRKQLHPHILQCVYISQFCYNFIIILSDDIISLIIYWKPTGNVNVIIYIMYHKL